MRKASLVFTIVTCSLLASSVSGADRRPGRGVSDHGASRGRDARADHRGNRRRERDCGERGAPADRRGRTGAGDAGDGGRRRHQRRRDRGGQGVHRAADALRADGDGAVRLRVSAAFQGKLTRVLSAPVLVTVSGRVDDGGDQRAGEPGVRECQPDPGDAARSATAQRRW